MAMPNVGHVIATPVLLVASCTYLAVTIKGTRSRARRLLLALGGGLCIAPVIYYLEQVGEITEWRRTFLSDMPAPLLKYTEIVTVFTTVALIGWRVQCRFDLLGLIIFVCALGGLGM